MSFHLGRCPDPHVASAKKTIQALQDKKRNRQLITPNTVCNYPSARFIDEAETDIVLIGNSVALAVLGRVAAGSEFRVRNVATNKRRSAGSFALHLQPTENIPSSAARKRQNGALIIAFATKTSRLESNARQELNRLCRR